MARPPRHKVEIVDALLGRETRAADIAGFLSHPKNQSLLRPFLRLDDTSYGALIEEILAGNEEALEYFDEKLNNPAALPRSLVLTPGIKKIIRRAQLKEEWGNLKNSVKRGTMFNMAANALSTALALRYTRRERQFVSMASLAGLAAGLSLNSLIITSADAALPPPPEDNLATAERAPMELTVRQSFNAPHEQSRHYINPYLYSKMQKSETAQQYFQWSVKYAMQENIYPVKFANQMFRESIHYNPDVVKCTKLSPKGAMGLSQIIKAKGGEYGMTQDDYCDAERSIAFGAKIMGDLTRQYNGDQDLAAAAYNGGNKAIHFAATELGLRVREISGDIWLAYNTARAEEKNNHQEFPFAWHNETREYVADLNGSGWEEKMIAWAKRQQGEGFTTADFQGMQTRYVAGVGIRRAATTGPAPQPAG